MLTRRELITVADSSCALASTMLPAASNSLGFDAVAHLIRLTCRAISVG